VTTILFEPHADDSVLFACYTLLAHRPTVITVLGGETVGQVDAKTRQWESMMAMAHVGVPYICWNGSESAPDWSAIWTRMAHLDRDEKIDCVWAPLPEPVDGHDHHDRIGEAALSVFGDRCRFYATYRRGSARTQTDNEVIPEPDWPAKKFQAMSMYVSQINLPATRPWFSDWDREWVV
jgi:hypothetical protein